MSNDIHTAVAPLLPHDLASQLRSSQPGAIEAANTWFIQQIQRIQRFVPMTLLESWESLRVQETAMPFVWQGSFVLADLSSFTAASEVLATLGNEGAEEITRVITHLFTVLINEIEHYGGDVIRFSGDALLAFFNAERYAQHAERACRAAVQIQEHMQALGQVETRGQTLELELRIGIHTGFMNALIVGNEQHRELSLFGSDLKRVTTAQHMADPGTIVISQATLAAVQAETKAIDAQYAILESLQTETDFEFNLIALPYGETYSVKDHAKLYTWLKSMVPQHLPIEYLVTERYEVINSIRLVTVVFVQFDSLHDDLLETLELPDAAYVLDRIYQRIQTTVNRFGGTVNKLDYDQFGERVIALFGAPISNDNDASLATQAAFVIEDEIADIFKELSRTIDRILPITMRITINSGHVFAGFVGSPDRLEYTVMGDTINVAARLLQLTEPNTITAGPLTTSIIEQRFDTLELPAARVKGKKEPIQATRVLGLRTSPVLSSHVPLIGREPELEQLLEYIQGLNEHQGVGVSIRGEPGIGKSRLLLEMIKETKLGFPNICVLHSECQFHEQITPFGVLRPLLQQLAQHHDVGRSIEHVLAWAERLVPGLSRFIPLLGDVLHREFPDSSLLEGLSAEQRHHRTLDLLEAIFWAAAEQQPLMIVIDDVHWIDLPSKELLERLYSYVEQHSVGLFLSYRPMLVETQTWDKHIVDLQELNTSSLIELATAFLDNAVPDELVKHWQQYDQGDFNPQGNPFFVQEVLRTLMIEGVLYTTEYGWRITGDIEALPTTIEGVIAARLDQLQHQTREIIQTAAVIGRRFSHQLLAYLMPEIAIEEHIQMLFDVDILIPDPLAADPVSMFKHDLTCEVAYQRILYARRRELHAQVASAMEDLYSYRIQEIQPLLAHHYAASEDWLTAARYALGAGKHAQEQYFNHEAIEHYSDGIKWLQHLSKREHKLLIQFYERRGYVQIQTGNYDAALESLQSALHLVEQARIKPAEIARIMRHTATVYERRAEYDLCLQALENALNVLNQQQTLERARVLLVGAGPHVRQGRYHDVINWVEEALEITKEEGAFLEQMHAYKLLGTAHAMIGNSDTAIDFYQKSIAIAERLDPPDLTRLSDVYNDLAITLSERGQLNEAIDLYKQAYDIKTMIGDVYGQALLMTNLGEAYRKLDLLDEAITSFQSGLERWEALGSRYGIAVTNINLGATLIAREGFIAARRFLDQSLLLCEEIGSEEFLSEIERHYAELELKTGNYAAAMQHVQQAIWHAQRLEARLDEGLAKHLHGRIWLAMEQPQNAVDALEQALTVFEHVEDKESQEACLEDLATAWYTIDADRSRDYATQSLKLRSTL